MLRMSGGSATAHGTQPEKKAGFLGRVIVRTGPHYYNDEKRLKSKNFAIDIGAKVTENTREIAATEYPYEHNKGIFEPLRRAMIAGYSVLAGGFCSLLNPKRTFHDLFIRDSRGKVNERKHSEDFRFYRVEKSNDVFHKLYDGSLLSNHENIFKSGTFGHGDTIQERVLKDTDKSYDPETPIEELKEKIDDYYKKSFKPLYDPYTKLLKKIDSHGNGEAKVGKNATETYNNVQNTYGDIFTAYADAENAAQDALKSPHEGIKEFAGMIRTQLNGELKRWKQPNLNLWDVALYQEIVKQAVKA